MLCVHIAESKKSSQPVTKLRKGFVIDGVRRICLASFTALSSMRPRRFSLFKPNHFCNLVLSTFRLADAVSHRNKSRFFMARSGCRSRRKRYLPARRNEDFIRWVNGSIAGLSSEALPEFWYSCGASSSPTLLRLPSSGLQERPLNVAIPSATGLSEYPQLQPQHPV